jgi:hypothetical protein
MQNVGLLAIGSSFAGMFVCKINHIFFSETFYVFMNSVIMLNTYSFFAQTLILTKLQSHNHRSVLHGRFLTNRSEYIVLLLAVPQFPCFECYTCSCVLQTPETNLCVDFIFKCKYILFEVYRNYILLLQQEMMVKLNTALAHVIQMLNVNRFQRWSISSSSTSSMLLWKGLTILMHVL